MKIKIMKPATITSIGLVVVAASNLFTAPPFLAKAGWLLVGLGTVWFFMKK